MKKVRLFRQGHSPDFLFLSLLAVIVIFGIIMLSSASSDLGKLRFQDTYYYVKHQLAYGFGLGIVGFLFASFVHYRFWQKYAIIFLLAALLSLLLVFTPLGYSNAGASRWLDLGPFSFQPTEFLKFAFIIYIAAWLCPGKKEDGAFAIRQNNFWAGYMPFLIVSGVVAMLILLQHAATPLVIIMLGAVFIYFVSGAKMSYILWTIILGILILSIAVLTTNYRYERIMSFVNRVLPQETTETGDNYHLNQALIAIGNGGWAGVGFGKSTTKFKYLPEPIGDSIFAVIAEELGFIGAAGLIILFIFFFSRGVIIAKNSRDQFAKLVILGFIFEFAAQTFIHIGALSGVGPITGVPLPFISYGGTSLAVFLTMAGVIVNVSRYTG